MPVGYPQDALVRIERLEKLVDQLYTASQTRPAQDVIRSAAVTIGDPDGAHIKLIPMGDIGAEIHLTPASGTNPTKLQADTSAGYPGEAALHIVSGDAGAVSSELLLASGQVSMRILDGGGDAGGFAYWGSDRARFGFIDGSNDNYFDFSGNGISRHYGQWEDFGSLASNAGVLSGSWTIASGFVGATVHYPSTMDSNMGPVASLRDGASNPNFYHCLTSSTTSSYDHDWSPSGGLGGPLTGKAGYFWSFRH
ncbi:hypothetical protein Ssi03_50360 [Sphaerisporangium siamense]|uniref:Uncharacterized protein n=1 Tax=Sphaerisporangium siamense TaxID=795645 RepID=A0A7W7D928_9ACTN|nr:hypothetical protein [Sphaerisporangium siamense]MBB4702259.1 hypothetical protein [Sphaerisporangium siamense]GII87046.1 hypothetical protein Ssi03_50360 [Sphaerisporangium siamense]